ncbi:hypothetical protein ACIHFE_34085 [Streptomyces sp. NPDC052396]|uniref:hypothetical protein n=1 Tax=Streptomyces sp. NPDC052396 TaxID=3365689 RepID=UPI0037D66DD3
MQSAHLGNGFAEVAELYGAYSTVHTDLTTLSKLLHDQIDALRLAIGGAHNSYADTDTEQRDRMWAVQKELLKHYIPAKGDPFVPLPSTGPSEDKPGSNKVTM